QSPPTTRNAASNLSFSTPHIDFRVRCLQPLKESLQESANSAANQKPQNCPDNVREDQSPDQQTGRIDSRPVKPGKHSDDHQHWCGIKDRHEPPEIGSIEKINAEFRVLGLQTHMSFKIKI